MLNFKTLIFFVFTVVSSSIACTANAETNQNTLTTDTRSCFQEEDHKICESAYSFLLEKTKSSKASQLPLIYSQMSKLAEAGCSLGNSWLCNSLGFSHDVGRFDVVKNQSIATEYYQKACNLGNGVSCGNAGNMYRRGHGVAQSWESAQPLYIKGCKIESSETMAACEMYANALFFNIVNATLEMTVSPSSVEHKCANDALDGPTCVALGLAHFNGENGLPENEDIARNYWNKSCRETHYARACYMIALNELRKSHNDNQDPNSVTGMRVLGQACRFGEYEACKFATMAGVEAAFNIPSLMVEGRYYQCLQEPNLEDCEFAGDTYFNSSHISWENKYKTRFDRPKATAAWLTACRNFNVRCVEVAKIHLIGWAPAMDAPNLAIGILETACTKGDVGACTERETLISDTGGVQGSYIDPMINDNERFLLAKFDIEQGNVERGRETLQWLAFTEHRDAEFELAKAFQAGMPIKGRLEEMPGYRRDEVMWDLFERAADRGNQEAAYQTALHKYFENDHEGSDSYENAIARAIYLGASGAKELERAERAQNKAFLEQRHRDLVALQNRNIASRNAMDQQTVQRAWDQYYERQKEKDGGQVCGTVYGQYNSTYRTCMSKDHARKYYRGNF